MLRRSISFLKNLVLESDYSSIVNHKTIESLSKQDLAHIFKNESKVLRNIYLHNVIERWILDQENQDEFFLRKLRQLIIKSKLKLNSAEDEYLLLLEERIFSAQRPLKVLDVTIKLNKSEYVYAKFSNGHFLSSKKDIFQEVFAGDLLISNQRFLLQSQNKILSIYFSDIVNYNFRNYGFEFTSIGQVVYLLRIHDQITLKNTISNIFNRKIV